MDWESKMTVMKLVCETIKSENFWNSLECQTMLNIIDLLKVSLNTYFTKQSNGFDNSSLFK